MSKTVGQILLQLHQVKTCSPTQLYRYFRAAKIKPVAVRQRPQRYPDDTVERILAHLGLDGETDIQQTIGRVNRIPGMNELRRVRAKAGRAL